MNTYTIILTNGERISFKADYVQDVSIDNSLEFKVEHKGVVARINLDNVVGWIKAEGENG